MAYFDTVKTADFEAIKLGVASPDEIKEWSHGEIVKPETINYRTQKPEKGGLFAEEIFGPSKDWECYCGKYKRIRYKGIVCDKCGVEVTRSIVRRERMGHIELAAPVSHIWFLRGVPSKIGLALDMSVQNLEKVIYFANFIVTKVDEELRVQTAEQIDHEYQSKRKSIEADFERNIQDIKKKKAEKLEAAKDEAAKREVEKAILAELEANDQLKQEHLKTLADTVDEAKKELKDLKARQVMSENKYQDLSIKYGHVFEAGIGAEAINKLLSEIDLKKEAKKLSQEIEEIPDNKRRRLLRRLRLVKNLETNKVRPEWMVLNVLPVIPPDLRPMVQLDGGRFATSDLNDLYRRVINRNNRLKRLIELNAPEVICRNEKRMLQEAVDALIDNGARHGKTVTASTGQKRMLKSIADMLKGKQGRFRQNLLGKRVDYSGRSVIVIGPHLKLNQCGIPKRMALELFRPFVISELIKREYVHNVRSAGRFIESDREEIWDILEEVTRNAHVLLNRAPTLHRLGIQAFQPILIEGKAIQIHPLVCAAFNADFDGDQMAVHVPLTEQAKKEAAELMLSTKNLLKPATGQPVVSPSQDLVLGCYYLTIIRPDKNKPIKIFSSTDEAIIAQAAGSIHIWDPIKVMIDNKVIETTIGRINFNNILPPELQFINELLDKKALAGIITHSLDLLGQEKTVELLDNIKKVSFKYLTTSGLSWGMDDLSVPVGKTDLIKEANGKIDEVQNHFESGLLTSDERYTKVVEIWARVKDNITELSQGTLDKYGPVNLMIASGSRGSWGQLTQMMGMKGLVTNPAGETIELPVKGSFKEGFDVLEYFISTHGARKGLSDTALRTANAGYLTRRLIDVAQDIVITEEDCGDKEGFSYLRKEMEEVGDSLGTRIWSRILAKGVTDNKTKKVIARAGTMVDDKIAAKIDKAEVDEVHIRSVLTCQSPRGLCRKCYGYDLGFNKLVELGVAVGIIAAQSIGEPGTQLTMRTFHTGGVAGQDITQGLPRVEELFEARPVRKAGILSEVEGQARIEEIDNQKNIIIKHIGEMEVKVKAPLKGKKLLAQLKVKEGEKVDKDQVLFEHEGDTLDSPIAGTVSIKGQTITITGQAEQDKVYEVPAGFSVWVKDGQAVAVGDQITEGSLNLFHILRLRGQEAVQKYLTKEIQYIYSSQGQKLNDKHIEVIARQMFSRAFIKEPGDTEFLPGEIVGHQNVDYLNEKIIADGGKPAVMEQLLLGLTKASLSTDSFLSAASFQETARVLIDAAITGRVDNLHGLKENVIIGRLIPAGTGFKKIIEPGSKEEKKAGK
ncbi:MAG: DNA-directed RNA polymerase subunit beta' [Patescibacteria group bacterium]